MALLFAFPVLGLAQSPPRLEGVTIGLPGGRDAQESGRSRNNAWCPVYVTVHGDDQHGNPQGAYQLAVESTDLEDVPYRYPVPVPALSPGEERVVIGYAYPVSDASDFTVKLETKARTPKVLQQKPNLKRPFADNAVVPPRHILFLAAGPNLRKFKQASDQLNADKNNPDDNAKNAPKGVEPDWHLTRRQVALIDNVLQLPDRWHGYDAVDVVVLATGNVDFVNKLATGDASRRNALLEWVRRGGSVVLSVGSNVQETANLLKAMPLANVELASSPASKKVSLPTLSTQWCNRPVHQKVLEVDELAGFKNLSGLQVLVREGENPVVVQGSCGLGRVILVGFDLDGSKFTSWDGHLAFWEKLQSELAPGLRRQGVKGPNVNAGLGMGNDTDYEMLANLKRGLELYPEVPVVSFGLVALFLVFYIALVGPVDYFLLKKVFKRLELTWITFPLTVLVVSVAAYFTAYALKGDELRVNKIDLVEYDLHEPKQVYGATWFSLFSPRVQSYTVGIEPSTPNWAAPPPAGAPGPVLSLLEASDRGLRTGSQALFQKPYEFAEDATGLKQVQVQIWAARSFTASYRAPMPAERPAVEVRDLHGASGQLTSSRNAPPGLVGQVTNNLDVELRNASLFYREKWYDLGTLAPGQTIQLQPLFAVDARGQGRELSTWFSDTSVLAPGAAQTPSGRTQDSKFLEMYNSYVLLKPLMFWNASDGLQGSNAGLRNYDQSWRLKRASVAPLPEVPVYRDEAVLVARTLLTTDRAEAATESACSPSRLWLGALPGDPDHPQRPKLPGFLTQETYLRVYIPVHKALEKPANK